MKIDQHENENIVKELDEIENDPRKWQEFMATQAERSLRLWPGKKKWRNRETSFKSYGG
jgi:hypothetical protein